MGDIERNPQPSSNLCMLLAYSVATGRYFVCVQLLRVSISLARHRDGSSMSSANSRYPEASSRNILFNSVLSVSDARLSFAAASCKYFLDFSVDPAMAYSS